MDERKIIIITKILNDIAVENDPIVRKLIKRGILFSKNGTISINGTYLKEYFDFKYSENKTTYDARINLLQKLVDQIGKLISRISQTSVN